VRGTEHAVPSVSFEGLSLHYLERGSGEPVVFLHALAFDAEMWTPYLEAFSGSHRAIALDVADHGKTSSASGEYRIEALVDGVLGFFDKVEIERCHLVGLSMGGMLAMGASLRQPDRIATLSLLSTSADAEDARTRHRHERLLTQTVRRPVNALESELAVASVFSPDFLRRRPEVGEAFRSRLLAMPRDRYHRPTLAILQRPSLVHQLAAIRCPTLVVVGTEDTATPPAHARRIAGAIPGAELVELEGCGHMSAIENPDEVIAALRRNFARATFVETESRPVYKSARPCPL
jgi:3-oxoadipate enol-lactonase